MTAQTDTYTPTEPAVIAGVSLRDVHRMIDEQILPAGLFGAEDWRSFKGQACVFISFYFGAADRLTAEERLRTIALASTMAGWTKTKKIVQHEFLTIDFASFAKRVEDRMHRLRMASAPVVSDPEILSGASPCWHHLRRLFRWHGFGGGPGDYSRRSSMSWIRMGISRIRSSKPLSLRMN